MLVSFQVRDDVALETAFRHRATGMKRNESLIIRCLSVLSVSLLTLIIDVFLFISVSLDDCRLHWQVQTRQHLHGSDDGQRGCSTRSVRAQRRHCRSDR